MKTIIIAYIILSYPINYLLLKQVDCTDQEMRNLLAFSLVFSPITLPITLAMGGLEYFGIFTKYIGRLLF